MVRDFSISALVMGFLVAFTGFASSFAVVLQGLEAMGASAAQAESGLLAASVAMGLSGIILSIWSRIPVSAAWSTPGAALLAASAPLAGGYSEAVGAFIISGALLMFAGMWRPLAAFIAAIPRSLANAMLAGILMTLCLAPVKAMGEMPLLAAPIIIAWAAGGFLNRLLAVPAALIAFCAVIAFGFELGDALPQGSLVGEAILTTPTFSIAGTLGIALPLFIVTMASQNVPGITVLRSAGYPTDLRWVGVTGAFSLVSAPFGSLGVNMAAITAAMCVSEDAHPDPARRYWSAIVAGVLYVLLGLTAGLVIGFVAIAPPLLIQTVAGLALVPAFGGALRAAFEDASSRDAAAITLLTAASGLSIAGIGGAFWGLLAGGALLKLKMLKRL